MRAAVSACASVPGSAGTLRGAAIPKYTRPLLIPRVMPMAGAGAGGAGLDHYEIAVRQIDQHVLPIELGLRPTTVWGYGSVHHPETFAYPSFTIEASWRRPVRVTWINDLRDPATGRFLPHLLPVDPTLHWANPPGGEQGRDRRPSFAGDSPPGPYRGPVPFVTHLHGTERVQQESDGYPEAWYLPAATDIPEGYAETGTFYDHYKRTSQLGHLWAPGAAVFEYPNDQRATTLWYHDHTLGITRLNVYAGPAGFYLLRGGPDDLPRGALPGPAPRPGDPPGARVYEIPLVIQDRSFNDDGSLFYPGTRGLSPPHDALYIPRGDVPPIWVPEFFGDVIVVNGQTWPYLEVEQRRYRFRILNGSGSRFLILKMENDLPFWQIGSDGGFLPAPVERRTLLLAPAERADVIVDFSGVRAGTEIVLLNLGPDAPFPGDTAARADPATTGQVMQLRVVPATSTDTSTPPHRLTLPPLTRLGDEEVVRRLSLNDVSSGLQPDAGVLRTALLGTLAPPPGSSTPRPLCWDDPITENPTVGSTEVWEIYNFTVDAHPIHVHELQFQIVDRRPFDGPPRPPDAGEEGFKDTVIAFPSEITRIKMKFERPGRFVWHCHILEHEDNEMMRPYQIGPMPRDIPRR